MKNPCEKCCVNILCESTCLNREYYLTFCEKNLNYFINRSKRPNKPKNFDRKYLIALNRFEQAKKDEAKRLEYRWSFTSTSMSVGSSTYREPTLLQKKRWRKNLFKLPEHHEGKKDYLRGKQI